MRYFYIICGVGLLGGISTWSMAQTAPRNLSKPLTSHTQRFPLYAGPYQGAMPRPTSPPRIEAPHHRPLPHHPPHGGYPMRPGVSIIYRAPRYSTYNQQTNSYVYGDGDSSIESRDYVLITDWRRLGLPDPPEGMHWIYENGRYALEAD